MHVAAFFPPNRRECSRSPGGALRCVGRGKERLERHFAPKGTVGLQRRLEATLEVLAGRFVAGGGPPTTAAMTNARGAARAENTVRSPPEPG